MRRVAIITGAAVVLFAMLVWTGRPAMDVVVGLTFGWLRYTARVLPQVKVSWDGVATGVLCLALFTFGLHRTLRWFYGEIQGASGAAVEGRRSWSPRWTVSLVTLIVLIFVVGMSATGVVHQAGWLIASRRSLVEKRARQPYGMRSSEDCLKEIGLAWVQFSYSGQSPSGEFHTNRDPPQSWMTKSLAFANFDLGGELRRDLPWNDPRNSAYFKGVVPIFLNPEVVVYRNPAGYALSHYAGNIHVLGQDRRFRWGVDGVASNTILAGEVAERFKPWGDPTNLRDPGLGINQSPDGFGGPLGKGAYIAFMDGSVRFLRETTPKDVLRRMSLPRPLDR